MTYTQSIEKIFNKINCLAQIGPIKIYDYMLYIDQLVNNGQYTMLQDVMFKYYHLDIRKYDSLVDMKKKTYPIVRKQTYSTYQYNLKNIFDSYNVYTIGFYFFDSNTNLYLGDIRETEIPYNAYFYKDPDYTAIDTAANNGQIQIIQLEIYIGLSESIYNAIPQFVTDPQMTIQYASQSQVIWDNQIYECVQPYTWNKYNQITPDNSIYWDQTYAPTYSYTLISDNTVPLLNKYQQALEIITNYTPNINDTYNNYIENGYISDYFQ